MSTVTEPSRRTESPSPEPADEIRSRPGTPTWELARAYPCQGDWEEAEYLALEQNLGIEFNDGVLEFLPMPTKQHHRIMQFLYRLLHDFVTGKNLGEVFVMGFPVRTLPRKLREPDVFFVSATREASNSFSSGCDLAIEVVSAGGENRHRDLKLKRSEYAAAGIPEFWIVDRETTTITVLSLPEGAREYALHGEFSPGQTASSVLLDGFVVDVAACFAAGEATDEA